MKSNDGLCFNLPDLDRRRSHDIDGEESGSCFGINLSDVWTVLIDWPSLSRKNGFFESSDDFGKVGQAHRVYQTTSLSLARVCLYDGFPLR